MALRRRALRRARPRRRRSEEHGLRFLLRAGRVAPAADGSVWVGTFHGLWHVTPTAPDALAQRFDLGAATYPRATSRVQTLGIDPSGSVWVGSAANGVYRVGNSGKVDHCGNEVEGCTFVRDSCFDGEGGVWAAYFGGLARFDIATFRAGVVPNVILRPSDGLPGIDTQALLALAPDHFLLASTAGITEIDRDTSGRWKAGATLDRRSGLPRDNATTLARDAAGNLWIGFVNGGLTKRIAGGFVGQDDAEKPGTRIMALGRHRDGRLIVLSAAGALRWTIGIVSRDRHETYRRPPLPTGSVYVGWGRQQLIAQEANGTFWVAGGGGAMRFGGSSADPSLTGSPKRAAAVPRISSIDIGSCSVTDFMTRQPWPGRSPGSRRIWPQRAVQIRANAGIGTLS